LQFLKNTGISLEILTLQVVEEVVMKLGKTMMVSLLLAVVALFLLGGCTQRVLDFTVVSSKQMELRVKDTGKGNRVEGKDGVYWLITIPLGTPNLKEAVDRAIESAGPGYDALIDGVIYAQNYWYIITGYSGYKIVGTPIKTSELKAELLKDGKDVGLAMKDVLFHSSLGLSNDEAIASLGIIAVNDLDKAGAEISR
jgi:hypothetical protein